MAGRIQAALATRPLSNQKHSGWRRDSDAWTGGHWRCATSERGKEYTDADEEKVFVDLEALQEMKDFGSRKAAENMKLMLLCWMLAIP